MVFYTDYGLDAPVPSWDTNHPLAFAINKLAESVVFIPNTAATMYWQVKHSFFESSKFLAMAKTAQGLQVTLETLTVTEPDIFVRFGNYVVRESYNTFFLKFFSTFFKTQKKESTEDEMFKYFQEEVQPLLLLKIPKMEDALVEDVARLTQKTTYSKYPKYKQKLENVLKRLPEEFRKKVENKIEEYERE